MPEGYALTSEEEKHPAYYSVPVEKRVGAERREQYRQAERGRQGQRESVRKDDSQGGAGETEIDGDPQVPSHVLFRFLGQLLFNRAGSVAPGITRGGANAPPPDSSVTRAPGPAGCMPLSGATPA